MKYLHLQWYEQSDAKWSGVGVAEEVQDYKDFKMLKGSFCSGYEEESNTVSTVSRYIGKFN